MTPVASLSMYLRPETRAAYDRLWSLVRDRLRNAGLAAPYALTDDGLGDAFWLQPGLVLSQTCGYPYRAGLKGRVNLVGAPDYDLAGCDAGFYRSVFVVRRDSRAWSLAELNGAAFAYNSEDSQSGYQGPLAFARSEGVTLQPLRKTGAHVRSAEAVLRGEADVAALDAVTWRDCCRYDAWVSDLRVVSETHAVPGLPYICAQFVDPEPVREAVVNALGALGPDDREVLGIRSLVLLGDSDYADAAFAPPSG